MINKIVTYIAVVGLLVIEFASARWDRRAANWSAWW